MVPASGDESLRRRYIRGLRRPPHNHNVHAIRCPAGIRQGTPGSKYGGLGSAQFLAGRRGQSPLHRSLREGAVFGRELKPLRTRREGRGTHGRRARQRCTGARRPPSCWEWRCCSSATSSSVHSSLASRRTHRPHRRPGRLHALRHPHLRLCSTSLPHSPMAPLSERACTSSSRPTVWRGELSRVHCRRSRHPPPVSP